MSVENRVLLIFMEKLIIHGERHLIIYCPILPCVELIFCLIQRPALCINLILVGISVFGEYYKGTRTMVMIDAIYKDKLLNESDYSAGKTSSYETKGGLLECRNRAFIFV